MTTKKEKHHNFLWKKYSSLIFLNLYSSLNKDLIEKLNIK